LEQTDRTDTGSPSNVVCLDNSVICYHDPQKSMHEAASSQPAWSRPADPTILEFLAERDPEYPAIIANRIGMHAPYVETRCEELADRGLVEPVSGEVVYRLTDRGERALDAGALPE
jgi:hypothetical protein